MTSPWEVLGLDPATATADSVRRAYVRLVKEHRPDRDPVHFQAIREAYEQAKRLLEYQAETGAPLEALSLFEFDGSWAVGQAWDEDADDADDEEDEEDEEDLTPANETAYAPAVRLDVPPAPDETKPESPFATFEGAREAGDLEAQQRILWEARRDWLRDPDRYPAFVDLAGSAPSVYATIVGEATARADGLLETERGSWALTEAMISVWIARSEWFRIAEYADDLLERPEFPVGSPGETATAFAMAALAGAFALKDLPRARRLTEEAHRRLPLGLREGALHGADVALRMADDLRDLSAEDRETLARALQAEDGEPVGGTGLAVWNAMQAVHHESVTWHVLRERFPESSRAVRSSRRIADRAARKIVRTDSVFSRTWIFIAVFSMVVIGRALIRHMRDDPFETAPPATAYDLLGDTDDQVDELLGRSRRGSSAVETAEELPFAYDGRTWLIPIRLRLEREYRIDPDVVGPLLRGEGEVRRNSPRYPEMLRVFGSDRTLPRPLRERSREELARWQAEGARSR